MADIFDMHNTKITVGSEIYTEKIKDGQSNFYIVNKVYNAPSNDDFPEHLVECQSTDPTDNITHYFRPQDIEVVFSGNGTKEYHND